MFDKQCLIVWQGPNATLLNVYLTYIPDSVSKAQGQLPNALNKFPLRFLNQSADQARKWLA